MIKYTHARTHAAVPVPGLAWPGLAWPGLLNINSVCVLNCINYITVIL
jgi:hypothetical protein